MRTQKFSHMRGGKALGVIFMILLAALVVIYFLVLRDKNVDIVSTLFILAAVAGAGWFTYKFYKPAFTDVVFSDDGIVSRTNFEKEELLAKEIKGIWYFRNTPSDDKEIKPYSEGENLKGCVVIIGDIDCFNNVSYVGMNGVNMLCDSFKKGYTTLHYRKELDEALQYYISKIKNRTQAE